ncbi:hypothetical protein BDA96_05G235700 [Sorghum bicolor]|uniref:Uncharacterized protein n=1 Tax=Sorghum bicolor TaxID=4558 RepID=A0A921UGU2_SORBI|nr:hypothetical protein BDA96_05G235700 [Sorghum bicolor]
MPSFLVMEIYFLLFFSGDGEMVRWNHFLHGGSVKDVGNYDIGILTDLMTWRLLFPDGYIKTEMVSPPWSNFLGRSLPRFNIRFCHDEGLERISFRSLFLILQWQKEKEERHQKRRSFTTPLHEYWPSFVWASVLRPFAECLHM